MVKIIHLADTHLGYRARKGTINQWAVKNYSKPYEQEIYDIFLKVMNNISKMGNVDFVVHCGDMFHMPSKYSSYPPQEPARRVLKEGLDLFFKNTGNKVPLIYIEGNHGVYRGYEYTPFESIINNDNYSNLFYYKERDLLEAIKNNHPLTLEFKEKKTRFFLFPYFEFKSFEVYKNAYNNWISVQKPDENDNYINIAVAHGSEADDTLHKKIKFDDYEYDYLALGHEHGLIEKSKNRFYAGSLLPMNFKESLEQQGYLIIDIDDEKHDLKIKKILSNQLITRPFEIIPVDISPQETSEELRNKIKLILDNYIDSDGFNPKTSARLKLNFFGEMTFEKVWLINDLMIKFRRECFSEIDKYNILQLIWKTTDMSERFENDTSPGIIEDFILENPEEEFKDFVKEKLSDDSSQFNVDKLTEFGMEALKNALKIMDREEEV